MYLKCAVNRQLSLLSACLSSLLACALFACTAGAQTPATDNKPADAKSGEQIYQTLYLTYPTEQNSFNDIETDLRNILPRAKIFGVASQNAISLRATAEDIETAKSVLADLDEPRKVYRLTYTITAAEGSQPGATQHYTLIVASGDRTVFKEGSRVPIVVGSTTKDASQSSDVQYLDVGLSINASLATSADALTLHSKLELSSLAAQTSGARARDPDVRQTVLDGTSVLMPGKPLMLGSLDAPGAAGHWEAEVVAELLK